MKFAVVENTETIQAKGEEGGVKRKGCESSGEEESINKQRKKKNATPCSEFREENRGRGYGFKKE